MKISRDPDTSFPGISSPAVPGGKPNHKILGSVLSVVSDFTELAEQVYRSRLPNKQRMQII